MRKCNCHSHNGFLLSPEGLAQREDVRPGVDDMALRSYLDKEGSVSGLRRDEDMYALISDINIDEQARRFHNGS